MGAEGEGVPEELSPPLLLSKGTLYNLPDNPKVIWLDHCPTLPLPFSCAEKLRAQPQPWSLEDQVRG